VFRQRCEVPCQAAEGPSVIRYRCSGLRGHPQAAVMACRPPFAIAHAPGRMSVTDIRDEEYRIV
jgi:uncharacterized protein YcsI (UPF0317 family)